jgi:hypothetical protein
MAARLQTGADPIGARPLGSVRKTSRLFTVEETPRLLGWVAEIVSLVADEAFYSLDAPIVRITAPYVPLAAAPSRESLAMPSVARIVDTMRRSVEDVDALQARANLGYLIDAQASQGREADISAVATHIRRAAEPLRAGGSSPAAVRSAPVQPKSGGGI